MAEDGGSREGRADVGYGRPVSDETHDPDDERGAMAVAAAPADQNERIVLAMRGLAEVDEAIAALRSASYGYNPAKQDGRASEAVRERLVVLAEVADRVARVV